MLSNSQTPFLRSVSFEFSSTCTTSATLHDGKPISAPIHSASDHTKSQIAVPHTKLAYLEDSATVSLTTNVESIFHASSLPDLERDAFKNASQDSIVLVTSATLFYVQGGGQPSDTGTIYRHYLHNDCSLKFHVETVRHGANGQVYHFGHFDPQSETEEFLFSPGEAVTQLIDSRKRDLHSRIHDAGHILSLAILDLVAGGTIPGPLVDSKGQHYPGAAYVEFVGLIDGKWKNAIQHRVDEMVDADLSVQTAFLEPAEAESRCVHGLDGARVPEGEKVRVVDIVGAGAYPCGGTHVVSTKGVGKLVVRNIRRQKGISKVTYEVR